MHWRVAVDVVPDGTHGLLEGLCLAPFPFEVVAAQALTEQLSTIGIEEMPGCNEVEGGVGRAQTSNIENAGESAL